MRGPLPLIRRLTIQMISPSVLNCFRGYDIIVATSKRNNGVRTGDHTEASLNESVHDTFKAVFHREVAGENVVLDSSRRVDFCGKISQYRSFLTPYRGFRLQ